MQQSGSPGECPWRGRSIGFYNQLLGPDRAAPLVTGASAPAEPRPSDHSPYRARHQLRCR